MERRDFLAIGTGVGAAAAVACRSRAAVSGQAGDLDEATIAGLAERMKSGELTARSIAERYLERIEAMDRSGPTLNSVIELNPDVLAIADRLDAERRSGRLRGPLHGIPVLLKDNIDTADKMRTSAGSLALATSTPPRDAPLVERLRAAGAVLLGKTNLSEWANFRSSRSTSGWSGRGGQTRNPYALDRNPCGSSSGSAAAVSANLTAVAVGTETDGSIVCPSNACGIVGIKPTLGMVSQRGIIPIAHSQDTAGPMARTVADAAALLAVLAGADYTGSLDPAGLRGARIGVARNFFGFHDRVDGVMEDALRAMREAGATLVDPAELPHQGDYDDSEFAVLLYEFKADLNAYLAGLGPEAPAKSLAELIAFNERHRNREMPYFGQEIFLQAEEKGPLTEREYRDALAKNHRLSREEGIDALLARHRLDAIVAPTGGPAWLTDLVNGDHFGGGSSTPAAVAGYPNITVPAGFVFGLPVGISFVGAARSEATLIRLAYAFERATTARRTPRFLPTAELSG